jgi:hypothetical protein
MFEIARKKNVAVFARFVDFPTFLKYTSDMTDNALNPKPYEQSDVNQATPEPSEGRAALEDLLQANWNMVATSPQEGNVEITNSPATILTKKIAANDNPIYYEVTKRQTHVR